MSVSSRRVFLQAVGALSLAGQMPARMAKSDLPKLKYISGPESIDVWEQLGGRWRKVQAVTSSSPSSLVLHPSGGYLFAANNIDNFEGLPAGSVEAYCIDPDSRRLALLNRQALSLSATRPRDLAVSPDGRWLVVAVYGGGAFNVLPITDGKLGKVAQIVKEIGSSRHPEQQASAHPHSIVFHPAGRYLIASDLGSDRLTVFRFEQGQLVRHSQVAVPTGSGPAHMALHSSGTGLIVRHSLIPGQSSYRFDAERGELCSC